MSDVSDDQMKAFLVNVAFVTGATIGGYLLGDAPDVPQKDKRPGTVAAIVGTVTALALANKKGLQKISHSVKEALMPPVHDTANTRYDDLPDSVVDIDHTVAESKTNSETITFKSAQAMVARVKKGLNL